MTPDQLREIEDGKDRFRNRAADVVRQIVLTNTNGDERAAELARGVIMSIPEPDSTKALLSEIRQLKNDMVPHSEGACRKAMAQEVRMCVEHERKVLGRHISALESQIKELQSTNLRLANENAALVAQLPHGFMFPKERDGDCRMVD